MFYVCCRTTNPRAVQLPLCLCGFVFPLRNKVRVRSCTSYSWQALGPGCSCCGGMPLVLVQRYSSSFPKVGGARVYGLETNARMAQLALWWCAPIC